MLALPSNKSHQINIGLLLNNLVLGLLTSQGNFPAKCHIFFTKFTNFKTKYFCQFFSHKNWDCYVKYVYIWRKCSNCKKKTAV